MARRFRRGRQVRYRQPAGIERQQRNRCRRPVVDDVKAAVVGQHVVIGIDIELDPV